MECFKEGLIFESIFYIPTAGNKVNSIEIDELQSLQRLSAPSADQTEYTTSMTLFCLS